MQGSVALLIVQNPQCFVGSLPEIRSLHLEALGH